MALHVMFTNCVLIDAAPNHYTENYSGGFARGEKMILNLGFMIKFSDININFTHIVFHELGHAVGLPHIEMEIDNVKYTDFPDNIMGGENIPLKDVDDNLYRLRNMWIRDYKPLDFASQTYSQPTEFELGRSSWNDPFRLTQ